jgi:hypothetical protein
MYPLFSCLYILDIPQSLQVFAEKVENMLGQAFCPSKVSMQATTFWTFVFRVLFSSGIRSDYIKLY